MSFSAVDQAVAWPRWRYSWRRSSYNTKKNISAFK